MDCLSGRKVNRKDGDQGGGLRTAQRHDVTEHASEWTDVVGGERPGLVGAGTWVPQVPPRSLRGAWRSQHWLKVFVNSCLDPRAQTPYGKPPLGRPRSLPVSVSCCLGPGVQRTQPGVCPLWLLSARSGHPEGGVFICYGGPYVSGTSTSHWHTVGPREILAGEKNDGVSTQAFSRVGGGPVSRAGRDHLTVLPRV